MCSPTPRSWFRVPERRAAGRGVALAPLRPRSPLSDRPLGAYAGLFVVSAAALLFELALTRVYAVAQGHHFAFMAIGMALLGIGASGTLIASSARLRAARPDAVIGASGLGFAATALAAYVTADRIPFDAYRIGADAWQLLWLGLYFLVAGVPFVFAGLAVIAALTADPARARTPYAVNLAGAATGAALSLVVLAVAGSAGAVLLAAGLATLAVAATARRRVVGTAGLLGAAGLAVAAGLVAPAGPQMSPYAGLWQILRQPGAQLVTTRLSASSRVDLVRGAAVRSAPGLSLAFAGELPPPRLAIAVDGTHVAALDVAPGDYLRHVPLAVALRVRPGQAALVLDPIGGFEIATLLAGGVRRIEVVQPDQALAATWSAAGTATPFGEPRVSVQVRGVRGALQSARGVDLLVWPLRESFQGVAAGAYSIRETYSYTEEAAREAWRALAPRGLLVTTRWLQAVPSESLRAWSTLAAAVGPAGQPRAQHLLAWRSLEVVTMLASPAPFTPAEIAAVDARLRRDRFDWVFYAGLASADANLFNVLPDDGLYHAFAAVARGQSPPASGFDVTPVTDDRPFFFHFFQWSQAGDVLAALGRTWQPFGGAGFLILIPLAAVATAAALAIIAAPLLGLRRVGASPRLPLRLVFFTLVGAGYVFVQIALLQRLILLLDAPTTAFAIGLAAMLGWTGVGSLAFGQAAGRTAWHALAAMALIAVVLAGLRLLTPAVLGTPLTVRVLIGIGAIAPAAIAMGAVLPAALAALASSPRWAIPWAWAANGVASVAAALAAAMVLVTFGFTATMAVGAALYGLAALGWVLSGRSAAASRA